MIFNNDFIHTPSVEFSKISLVFFRPSQGMNLTKGLQKSKNFKEEISVGFYL